MGNTLTRPDAAGKSQTLTWTAERQLGSATTTAGTSGYVYDAAGNRLLRRDPGRASSTSARRSSPSTPPLARSPEPATTRPRAAPPSGSGQHAHRGYGAVLMVGADEVDAVELYVRYCAVAVPSPEKAVRPAAAVRARTRRNHG
ncbi:hypothetical protein [Streptomyces sp. NPDC090445]|uniref:hypothetical protein n=1 Tax=Streptomyces sp. NPDC090445 TaxID=3365963 RepID=UPI003830D4FB